MSSVIDTVHAAAVTRGDHHYRDPETGYQVFSALGLEARGGCCGAGCRHCPFGHEWVPDVLRGELVQDPWISGVEAGPEPVDLLFWSGGKDSFLALHALAREGARGVVLLTRFDGRTQRVPRQEIGLDEIRDQAVRLDLGLVGVPLYAERDEHARIGLALRRLSARRPLARIVFGDLHRREDRARRERHLGGIADALGACLHFPLWEVPYRELEARLWASGAIPTVSAVASEMLEGRVAVGDRVTPGWLDALPPGVDRMGEGGEFHTRVRPPAGGWRALAG